MCPFCKGSTEWVNFLNIRTIGKATTRENVHFFSRIITNGEEFFRDMIIKVFCWGRFPPLFRNLLMDIPIFRQFFSFFCFYFNNSFFCSFNKRLHTCWRYSRWFNSSNFAHFFSLEKNTQAETYLKFFVPNFFLQCTVVNPSKPIIHAFDICEKKERTRNHKRSPMVVGVRISLRCKELISAAVIYLFSACIMLFIIKIIMIVIVHAERGPRSRVRATRYFSPEIIEARCINCRFAD